VKTPESPTRQCEDRSGLAYEEPRPSRRRFSSPSLPSRREGRDEADIPGTPICRLDLNHPPTVGGIPRHFCPLSAGVAFAEFSHRIRIEGCARALS
jgi:hypothetical protein